MIQIDSLRNSLGQQGLSRQSFESSDSNSSAISSPGSTAYHPVPTAPPPGDSRNNGMIPWTQGAATFPGAEGSDDDDEYRPFTPPPPRERLSYTRYQLELLNAIYSRVKYPNSTQKQLIAKRVGITRDQVKIWFQNRRRKDVVGRKPGDKKDGGEEKAESPKSESGSAETATKESSDVADDDAATDDIDEKVLPPLVMKSVIAELMRFENDPLKNKKNKKKSRKRPAPAPAVGPKPPQPMFQSYDMISPPNKVTPTAAFLNTVPNRFNHSKSASAFHNPRNPRLPGHMMLPGQSPFLMGMPHPASASSITVLPNDYINPPNTTVPQSLPPTGNHSLYDSIPVLADLLGYRSHVEASRQREHSLSQSHLPSQCSTVSSRSPENNLSETHAPSTQSALGLNRVFPFPFIADPPVMLSSIRHSDPYRPQLHYQPPSYSDEPYQPLVISSLSNPYFNATSSVSWANQSSSDSSVHPSSYTQL
ncbi:homeobox protein NOBOX-like [Haliotis cracherodii]|uniref:homeobox protein NOBOX-like n=1 Tax=Haliotis cracherodii TaxID=6455 RepID=UPI0039EAE87A